MRARPGLAILCQVLPLLDHCFSLFQMQDALPEAHGKDRCSGPLCFWYVSRALPQHRWRYLWAFAHPGREVGRALALAMWHWVRGCLSMSLSFPICKMNVPVRIKLEDGQEILLKAKKNSANCKVLSQPYYNNHYFLFWVSVASLQPPPLPPTAQVCFLKQGISSLHSVFKYNCQGQRRENF